MFPIGDDDSSRRSVPIVTYLLIVLNVLFFFVELSGGDPFIERWSVVPRRLMANPGADFITVFTSMFMHGGWLHLGGNMLYLWIFGDNVEDRLGHSMFTVFYFICGLAATFAQMAVNTHSNVANLGASGAIAGVLGAYIVMFPGQRVRVLMGRYVTTVSALVAIGLWILIQLFSGISTFTASSQTEGGGVAYMAHIGGFFAGLILAYVLGGTRRQVLPYR